MVINRNISSYKISVNGWEGNAVYWEEEDKKHLQISWIDGDKDSEDGMPANFVFSYNWEANINDLAFKLDAFYNDLYKQVMHTNSAVFTCKMPTTTKGKKYYGLSILQSYWPEKVIG